MSRQLAMAEHFLAIGRPARALEELEAAEESELEDPHSWLLRGAALFDLGRPADAADAARRGLERQPDSFSLLWLLADCEARQDRLAQAERAILAAMRLEPERPEALCAYARIAAQGGQVEKGLWLAWQAERLDPESPDTLKTRSLLEYVLGRDQVAADYNARVLRQDPEGVAGLAMRGTLQLERGDVAGARRSFEVAARADPSDRPVAEATRETRIAAHPLLWPVWPIERFGPIRLWLGMLGAIFVLAALDLAVPAAIVLVAYLFVVVYSWTGAPLARRWLRSRRP